MPCINRVEIRLSASTIRIINSPTWALSQGMAQPPRNWVVQKPPSSSSRVAMAMAKPKCGRASWPHKRGMTRSNNHTTSARLAVAASAVQAVASAPVGPIRPSQRASSQRVNRPRVSLREKSVVRVNSGAAVSRNPATAAMAKPQSISWACQSGPGRGVCGIQTRPPHIATQVRMARPAQIEAARKNGRKPQQNSGACCRRCHGPSRSSGVGESATAASLRCRDRLDWFADQLQRHIDCSRRQVVRLDGRQFKGRAHQRMLQ